MVIMAQWLSLFYLLLSFFGCGNLDFFPVMGNTGGGAVIIWTCVCGVAAGGGTWRHGCYDK